MKIWRVAAAILLASPPFAWGNAEGDRPVERLYADSERVVVADVVSVEASCVSLMPYCRPEYSVKLISRTSLKESPEAALDAVSVCTVLTLEVGATYTLFLEHPNEFTSQAKHCDLVIDKDAAFQMIGSYTYRVGSPDSQVIVDFEGRKYLTNAVVEPGFESMMAGLATKSAVR